MTCVSMHVIAISQHVKKARKSALREKVDRCDDDGKWTGDDDDDGQVRRGGMAIAMKGGWRTRNRGSPFEMRFA